MDKMFILCSLEELANRMRALFPQLVQGTNALESKLMLKLNEIDRLTPTSVASSGGPSGHTSTSSVSCARACTTHTFRNRPDGVAAPSSSVSVHSVPAVSSVKAGCRAVTSSHAAGDV